MAAIRFQDIIGHRDVIDYLKKTITENRVGHACLITGEAGSGRRTVAEAYAAALLCERTFSGEGSAEACGECASCRKIEGDSHPDLIVVTHEKPAVITVDEIRSQVVSTAGILPYEGRYKVYIIPDAEKMNAQAQNALLKTIEEPPEYAVFLLLASGPEQLLPTVLSRCVRLSLLPVPNRDVIDYLGRELHIPDYEAKVLAAYAQGNLGKAKKAAADEAFSVRRDRMLAMLKNLHKSNIAAVGEAVRLMKEDKDHIAELLDILLLWCRDVLYFKAAADVDGLVFSNEISTIRSQASASSYQGLTDILEAADLCRVRLRANVNFDLAVELLLLQVKEKLINA